MEDIYIKEKKINKIDCKEKNLKKGEYENCDFINCDSANTDLSEIVFTDCEFIGCNLSLAKLTKTAFRECKFKDSKMIGLNFENCNEFGLSFVIENCSLNHSSFYKLKIKKTIFKNSQLQETDFTECDLTSSLFDNCDLMRAIFYNTIIEKVDFQTSFNYSFDPEINRIKKSKFSLSGAKGLLSKYDISISE